MNREYEAQRIRIAELETEVLSLRVALEFERHRCYTEALKLRDRFLGFVREYRDRVPACGDVVRDFDWILREIDPRHEITQGRPDEGPP